MSNSTKRERIAPPRDGQLIPAARIGLCHDCGRALHCREHSVLGGPTHLASLLQGEKKGPALLKGGAVSYSNELAKNRRHHGNGR